MKQFGTELGQWYQGRLTHTTTSTWDVQPFKCLYMYTLRYSHSSSKRSYVRIKLRRDPIASCAKKQKRRRRRRRKTHRDRVPSQQSFGSSTCASFPGPDSHVYTTKTATRNKRSEYRASLNTPRGKHSIDILISLECNTFGDFFFLVTVFQILFCSFFFSFLLPHAFLRTVEVFGPYLVIVLSLTLRSDSSRCSPVSSPCSCLTFPFFLSTTI